MSVFQYKTYDIYYQIDGDIKKNPNVIVLLNGIMMSTQSWEIFVKPFSKENTLLRVDMIDQGQSSKVDFNYTQALQVDMLYALFQHLNMKNITMVGISYGASIALQFATKYPSNIQKLIVANGVAKTSKWLKAIGDGWNQVGRTRDGLAYYNITIPYIYSPLFYQNNIEWMENRKKLLVPIFSDPTFLNAMERLTISAETHDTLKDLHKIECETLIISSEQDFLTPPFEQEILHQNIGNSSLIKIPNCGHASMYEAPKLFSSIVLGFVHNTLNETIV
jgi:pimeloyl-ACP methyl ester carboxylesterase